MKKNYKIIFLTSITLIAIGVIFVFWDRFSIKTEEPALTATFSLNPVSAEVVPEDQEDSFQPPAIVKGIYVTSWSASKNSYINYLINIAKNTEINSVVIDIKDWSGYVGYNTNVPEVEKYGAESIRIRDIAGLIKKLHENGIYVIARIAIFQDPILAKNRPEIAIHSQSQPFFSPVYLLSSLVSLFPGASLWLDRLGLAWIDPAAKESWDYNISIAKDALSQGFDEINFDYVRFPSDGDLKNMVFPVWDGKTPRHLIIKEFFKYLREQLPDARLSIDLFGLSCCNVDDLGVGQVIEDAFPYFDYISPMVYPSHYANGFLGFQNPAEHPYEVVNYSIKRALQRLVAFQQNQQTGQSTSEPTNQKTSVQLRPWLQDFNLGAIYDAQMVRNEIQAVYDAAGENFNGFMLWSASNYYTETALQPESQ